MRSTQPKDDKKKIDKKYHDFVKGYLLQKIITFKNAVFKM